MEKKEDTISRQAAIDALDNRFKQHLSENLFESFEEADNETKWFCDGIMESIGAVMGLPSAQPQRMRGRWVPHKEMSREYIGMVLINVEYDYWFCNTCGYRVERGQPMHNYCPNCGADMREGQDETD